MCFFRWRTVSHISPRTVTHAVRDFCPLARGRVTGAQLMRCRQGLTVHVNSFISVTEKRSSYSRCIQTRIFEHTYLTVCERGEEELSHRACLHTVVGFPHGVSRCRSRRTTALITTNSALLLHPQLRLLLRLHRSPRVCGRAWRPSFAWNERRTS